MTGACVTLVQLFFFFKQKTAYEMRISDWSSDVCSSDLTSGSTGRPKGVMHSHRTALSFVDWCSDEFAPRAEDRFSSHAPFHFDLSILDLYVSIKHGAAIVLIGEELGNQPLRLAPVIAEQRITRSEEPTSELQSLIRN